MNSLFKQIIELVLISVLLMIFCVPASSADVSGTNVTDVHYSNPAISGDTVVWWENTHNKSIGNVISRNITSGTNSTLIENVSVHTIALSGNWIVWEANYDIYCYDISSKSMIQLTNDSAKQVSPDTDGYRVIWIDYRTGRYDIRMQTFYDIRMQTLLQEIQENETNYTAISERLRENETTYTTGIETVHPAAAPGPVPHVMLAVQSDPEGAAIILDGEEKGVTPMEIPLARPGQYNLSLILEGYPQHYETLDIDKSTTIELTYNSESDSWISTITSTTPGWPLSIFG